MRKIYVEYPQGWLTTRIELNPGSNAAWRTDPKRSGKAGCMGDIGTHALHLAEYISGLRCTEMCADLTTFLPGRELEDDGAALLRFDNGARGRTDGLAGWPWVTRTHSRYASTARREASSGGRRSPNTLLVKRTDRPTEIVRVGNGYMGAAAKANTRTPAGHPEGYIEAFANIYRNFARTVMAKRDGREPEASWLDFPGVDDGIRGMQFIETVVKSGYEQNVKWIKWIE